MGEPTLHPNLPEFIKIARDKGFLPMITTNGSLLKEKSDALLQCLPHKISISIHAPEANATFSDEGYLDECISFAKKASEMGSIVALRLWNIGSSADNSDTLSRLHSEFPGEWTPIRGGISEKLAHKVFLEWGVRFDWPDESAEEASPESDAFCYALRDQAGVLVDGTVVPCCLDADGKLALGNLFDSELEEILNSEKATAILKGFDNRRAVESLCRKCGFAKRFRKGNN